MSPFDFISGMETTEEEVELRKRRKSAKKMATVVIMGMVREKPEVIAKRVGELITGMDADGLDGREIIREVFPELVQ